MLNSFLSQEQILSNPSRSLYARIKVSTLKKKRKVRAKQGMGFVEVKNVIRQHIFHFLSMLQFSPISIEIKKSVPEVICSCCHRGFKGKPTSETSESVITVFRKRIR